MHSILPKLESVDGADAREMLSTLRLGDLQQRALALGVPQPEHQAHQRVPVGGGHQARELLAQVPVGGVDLHRGGHQASLAKTARASLTSSARSRWMKCPAPRR